MKRTIQGLLLAGSMVVGGAALAQANPGSQGMPKANPGSQGMPKANPGSQGMPAGSTQAGKGMAKGGMIEHMGFMVPADEKAMLERLHHVNQMEIQLGQLAQKNGQSQDVKSYGEMLVKDHTAGDQKLMAQAQQKGHKLAEPKPLNEMERTAMAAQKANMAKLQALTGAPFDSCFLSIMVGDHDEVLGKLTAGQQNMTDPAMTPLLQDMSKSVTMHRQQAYTLLGRIGPGSSAGMGGAGGQNPGMGHDMGTMGSGTGSTGTTGSTTGGTQGTGSSTQTGSSGTKK